MLLGQCTERFKHDGGAVVIIECVSLLTCSCGCMQVLEGGLHELRDAVSRARPHYHRLCAAVRQTTHVLPTPGCVAEPSVAQLVRTLQACDTQLQRVVRAARAVLPDTDTAIHDLTRDIPYMRVSPEATTEQEG
eukprot:m.1109647 g.1109647  ORF g.1109647 m.1109647 type:complete len:134 (+) comp24354_c0_seq1:161-562(+)